jgi:hypothetical protein
MYERIYGPLWRRARAVGGGGAIASSISPEDQRAISANLAQRGMGRSKIGAKIKKDILMDRIAEGLSPYDLTPEEREMLLQDVRGRIGSGSAAALEYEGGGGSQMRFFRPGEEAPILEYRPSVRGSRGVSSAYQKYMSANRA